jgi:uncharacterized glyoxalase superfamily protein PhnB
MLTSARPGRTTPGKSGAWTQSMTIYLDDVAAQFERVKKTGAKITLGLRETEYGEKVFSVEDLEGHSWEFSQHVRDMAPEEWGAVVKKKTGDRSQESE